MRRAVTSTERETGNAGRAAADPQPHSYVAVDLGGTQLRAALFTATGAMTARWSIPTPDTGGSGRVIEEVFRQITAAIDRAAAPPRAIGVSCLGHIDQDTGSILYVPRLPGLTRLPLGALLTERFALPVSVMNDANAAALAEWRLGAGRGAGTFCFVTVSTGIGCGLIINGHLLAGRHSGGGELGRMRLPGPAPAGTRLEDLASGTAIATAAQAAIAEGTAADLARLTGTRAPTAREVADAASLGEPSAARIMADAAITLGIQLANLVRLLSPEHIVIGGGVSRAGAVFWTPLREAVTASLQLDQIQPPPITPATLSDDAGLYGAVLSLLGNHQH